MTNSSSSRRRATHRLGLFSMASRAGSSDWRISQILKLIRGKTQSRLSEFNTGAPQSHDDAVCRYTFYPTTAAHACAAQALVAKGYLPEGAHNDSAAIKRFIAFSRFSYMRSSPEQPH